MYLTHNLFIILTGNINSRIYHIHTHYIYIYIYIYMQLYVYSLFHHFEQYARGQISPHSKDILIFLKKLKRLYTWPDKGIAHL